MLPVGQIDGGRVTQTGFGRRALGATSFGCVPRFIPGRNREQHFLVLGFVRFDLPANPRVFAARRRHGGVAGATTSRVVADFPRHNGSFAGRGCQLRSG